MTQIAVAALLTLTIVAGAQQGDDGYTALGSGHYVATVADHGRYITLEDRSRWEIEPRSVFRTAEWQPEEGIAIRRSTPSDGFDYEVDNTDRDEGVQARYLK